MDILCFCLVSIYFPLLLIKAALFSFWSNILPMGGLFRADSTPKSQRWSRPGQSKHFISLATVVGSAQDMWTKCSQTDLLSGLFERTIEKEIGSSSWAGDGKAHQLFHIYNNLPTPTVKERLAISFSIVLANSPGIQSAWLCGLFFNWDW